MNKALIIVAAVFFLASAMLFETYGGPVRNSRATYSQPDGSTFTAFVRGDEWIKVRTTSDGCAITKGDDGWWCYAVFNQEGRAENTGHRVGGNTPEHIKNASRTIPMKQFSERAASMRGIRQRNGLEAFRKPIMTKGGTEEGGSMRALIILAQFSDTKFRYAKDDFAALLNESGYNGTGSVKDYYEDQFGSAWEFTFDVSDVVTLPGEVKYYGANDDKTGSDARAGEMVRDACRLADASVDFSIYDSDGDGFADNVYIFYAGNDEAEFSDRTDLLWAHQWYLYHGAQIELFCDGVRIDRYACSAELSGERGLTGIGTFCHEYGHTFGLPDFYDIDYDSDGSWAAGLWRSTSLMDGGNYNNNAATPPNFNCIERRLLGLSEPEMFQAGNSYTLEPVHINGQYGMIETDTDGEYYLFECRSNEGWDRYIGGKGLLVYHIDENAEVYSEQDGKTVSRWHNNTLNAWQKHQAADLIEADGRSDLIIAAEDFRDISGIFFPLDDVTQLTPDSSPALKFWSGAKPDISVTGIRTDGDRISFSVVKSDDVTAVPDVVNVTYTIFPDAVIIKFESSDTSSDAVPMMNWRRSGGEYSTATPEEYEDGRYVCRIDNLESGNITYETQIRFEAGEALGRMFSRSFMTKRNPAVTWPYIFVSDGYATDGMPLHVVNASEAAEIEWFYNGKAAAADKDGWFRPAGSGTLTATVHWEDGSSDTIMKEIDIAAER